MHRSGSTGTTRAPTATWISFGVAGAAVATGVVFGLVTLKAKSDYDARPTSDGRDAFHRDVAITDVAFGVAAAAALLGVGWWLLAPSSYSPQLGSHPGIILF